MASKMYIYRAEMRRNGKEDKDTVYLYARNAKCAKKFCQENFDKFDKFTCVKFATTKTVDPSVNACFIDEEDDEMALVKANIAGNGEIYAERDAEED